MTDVNRLLNELDELREENRRLFNQTAELTNANEALKKEKELLEKEVTKLTQKNAGLEMIRERERKDVEQYFALLSKQVGDIKDVLQNAAK